MSAIPGPRSVVLTAQRYLRDPYAALLDAAKRYGDPFGWPSAFGRMIVTGDPDGIRTIFTADPSIYDALGANLLGPILGESNIILLGGERHRAMRKLQTPPFHGERMRAYGQLITDVAIEHAAQWPQSGPIPVHRTMQRISLDVILRAVLGVHEPAQRASWEARILSTVEALKPSFMFMPFLRHSFGGLGAWARFQKIRAQMQAVVSTELAARRASPEGREDILSLLMSARFDDGHGLTDEELFVQMMNLVVAGHETTASSLAWAFHHVHQDARVKARLLDELRALPDSAEPDAIAALPYLGAVCSETLRLRPVAPIIGRVLREPLTLKGHALPAGTPVGIAIVVTHRREDLYPDPESFRPERFLERTFTPFEFLPFGGGARRCLGAAFALYEMKLVLAAILRRHDLRATSSRKIGVAVRNTTVGPRGAIPLERTP